MELALMKDTNSVLLAFNNSHYLFHYVEICKRLGVEYDIVAINFWTPLFDKRIINVNDTANIIVFHATVIRKKNQK